MTFKDRIVFPGPNGLLEIAFMAVAIYYLLLFFKGTRGAQVLYGLGILYLGLMALTYLFELDTLNWLIQRFTVYLSVALLIIFQPEIRRALAELGPRHFSAGEREDRATVEALLEAVRRLAENKIGALIAIERGVNTAPYQEAATRLDSLLSPELLTSIFFPNSPLHDGGVIIRGGRIVAAGCLFPLSQKPELSRSLGTRHRAAIGLSEETDAIVIVVSEETGTVSVAYKGRLRRGIELDRLERFLINMLVRARHAGTSTAARSRRWLEVLRLPRPRVRETVAAALNEGSHGR
ncbi:MAG: diadenylate cyclase CdaA [Kiritimatiellae bacterium]|nr:diadenylate cyclase CdaA [Kiritimatiellia bacterium]MDW8457996.1 diadenylate cyclase CdaA [Verrucomicrobiota bacterium]